MNDLRLPQQDFSTVPVLAESRMRPKEVITLQDGTKEKSDEARESTDGSNVAKRESVSLSDNSRGGGKLSRTGRGNGAGSLATRFQTGMPSANPKGRPKIIREESSAWLNEADATGKTNARKMVETLGGLASSKNPLSVAAFKEMRQTVEPVPTDGEGGGNLNVGTMNVQLLALMQKVEVG